MELCPRKHLWRERKDDGGRGRRPLVRIGGKGPEGGLASVLGGCWWQGRRRAFEREKRKRLGSKTGDQRQAPRGWLEAHLNPSGAGSWRAAAKVEVWSVKLAAEVGRGVGSRVHTSLALWSGLAPSPSYIPAGWCWETSSRTQHYIFPKGDNYHLQDPSVCGFSTIFRFKKSGV